MNRKECILFYTEKDLNLISQIKNISFNFPVVSGMNFFYVEDKPEIKKCLKKNKIEQFPSLYITYYDKDPEILYGEKINLWISQILNLIFENMEEEKEVEKEDTQEIPIIPQHSDKKKVSFIAEEIQKERESSIIT